MVYSAAIIQKTDRILYVLFNFTLFDLEIFLYSFKKISHFMTSFLKPFKKLFIIDNFLKATDICINV